MTEFAYKIFWTKIGEMTMAKKSPVVIAMLYDFDKTLCTKNMQEYSFIPRLEISDRAFWDEANSFARDEGMDPILASMYQMIRKSRAKEHPVRREDFVSLGADIEYFPGVPDWFDRISAFGRECGAVIEHYIISSGLKEIIEGSSIAKAKCFKQIYACEFWYDENGVAVWPRLVVNYTTKTQFLFRVNKGVLDISDDESLNRYQPDEERRIPFRNMIYIGDGFTDVPCMKLVKANGGQSIAVYPKRGKKQALELLRDDRVNFVTAADYTEEGELAPLIRDIVSEMVIEDGLVTLHRRQMQDARR